MLPTGSLVTKDPDASEWPRGIDWTIYLERLDPAEIITTSTWAITGPDSSLTFDQSNDSIVTGGKKTQLKLAGGTAGKRYTVTNRIVTSSGAIDDRSFLVKIREE